MDWVGAPTRLTLLTQGGDIAVEQADDAGPQWLASRPAGEAIGPLAEVLVACAAAGTDPLWIEAAVQAIHRELARQVRRSRLLVKCGSGTWYHVTFASNRESILKHGLDWRRMAGHGIAGSPAPEYPGIFLCADLEAADFFVMIGTRRGPVDIWQVELDGQWLIGAPASDGGGGEDWMICAQPIPVDKLSLARESPTDR